MLNSINHVAVWTKIKVSILKYPKSVINRQTPNIWELIKSLYNTSYSNLNRKLSVHIKGKRFSKWHMFIALPPFSNYSCPKHTTLNNDEKVHVLQNLHEWGIEGGSHQTDIKVLDAQNHKVLNKTFNLHTPSFMQKRK